MKNSLLILFCFILGAGSLSAQTLELGVWSLPNSAFSYSGVNLLYRKPLLKERTLRLGVFLEGNQLYREEWEVSADRTLLKRDSVAGYLVGFQFGLEKTHISCDFLEFYTGLDAQLGAGRSVERQITFVNDLLPINRSEKNADGLQLGTNAVALMGVRISKNGKMGATFEPSVRIRGVYTSFGDSGERFDFNMEGIFLRLGAWFRLGT
ncbi:MAG: hypothetical protein AAGI38_18985 [Bacteroidota bacterium]